MSNRTKNGKVAGTGKLNWTRAGKPYAVYQGAMAGGKAGGVYQGMFKNGGADGPFLVTAKLGAKTVVETWKDGKRVK